MKLWKEFVAEPLPAANPPATETAEEILAKKEEFAEHFLRSPDNAFAVACIVYPNDTGKALRIATEWPNDPQIKTLMQSLQDAAEEFAYHPTKEQFARTLLNNAELLLSSDPQTAHKYHDSYRKMRWPDAAVSISDNRVVNNVLVVKDHGTPDQWEEKLVRQQRRLKEDSVVSTIEKAN